jgi:hypothetical protein
MRQEGQSLGGDLVGAWVSGTKKEKSEKNLLGATKKPGRARPKPLKIKSKSFVMLADKKNRQKTALCEIN